jgi:cyclohexa-1,5-dienecarbonyl-CoA hydratase
MTRTATPPLRIEPRHDGSVLRLVIDRPKANIVTAEVIDALRQAIALVPASGSVKLITLEGAGDHFSYGASVEEHLPERIATVLPALHALVRDIVNIPAWTIAVVRGRCLGGGFELALACDAIVASEDALLGLPEINLGVFPPAGTALLPARVGAASAARSVLTGDALPAAWWLAAGLVQTIAPAAALDEDVDAWFARYCEKRSAAAIRIAARAARWPVRHAAEVVLPELERLYLTELMKTADAAEGIRAFVEKRPPVWTHR